MDRNLLVYSVIGGETEGNFLLREKQYFAKNNLAQAQWVTSNKINNQLQLLKNIRQKNEDLKVAILQIKKLLAKVDTVDEFRGLLGLEGNVSKLFFSQYFKNYAWKGRKPRTKQDELNVLLDIGYTYLFNFIDAHLRLYGFDTYKGFYHTEFYRRKSLVCDLVEPFRCIIDQALLKALNLKQFDLDDFEVKHYKYKLKRGFGKKYSKIFLVAIMDHKEEIFVYFQKYYRNLMKNEQDFPDFKI